MRELNIEEAKKIELRILLHLDNFFKKNKKTYFLAYGTLLGAIRHKGFIPWDDDIDLYMPRDDYNWLIANYNELNQDERFKLISPFMKESKHSFVKVIDTHTIKIESGLDYGFGYLGVDVDIFPLDGEPDSDTTFKKWFKYLRRIYKLFVFCVLDESLSLKRKVCIPLIRLLTGGRYKLLKVAKVLHDKFPYNEAKFVGSIECPYVNKGERFEKDCFAEAIAVSFEGHKFPAPVGYDKVLTSVYGDYMQLPPVEKRVTHHANKMYVKNDSQLL